MPSVSLLGRRACLLELGAPRRAPGSGGRGGGVKASTSVGMRGEGIACRLLPLPLVVTDRAAGRPSIGTPSVLRRPETRFARVAQVVWYGHRELRREGLAFWVERILRTHTARCDTDCNLRPTTSYHAPSAAFRAHKTTNISHSLFKSPWSPSPSNCHPARP
jgi:hypothetical protein